MTANERRQAILEVLCVRRHEKANVLAFEFDVSLRTINTDINFLAESYPIYTTTGKYGGIFMMEGYYLHNSRMTKEQTELLKRILPTLPEKDKDTMNEIIKNFGSFWK